MNEIAVPWREWITSGCQTIRLQKLLTDTDAKQCKLIGENKKEQGTVMEGTAVACFRVLMRHSMKRMFLKLEDKEYESKRMRSIRLNKYRHVVSASKSALFEWARGEI